MNELEQMQADAVLDPDIRFEEPWSNHWADPQAILLTGATGFLGAYLLDELLRETRADIHCLVRAAGRDAAMARLRGHLEHYGLWREEFAPRIIAAAGDLSLPGLGLAPPDFSRLAGRIDVIYHNGAWINAVLSYDDLKTVNVEGTREVLRFAGLAQTKPVHFVSTLALFLGQAHAHRPLAETDIPVLDKSLRGGYKRTKWVAEQLVRNARTRGLPATIYRPGRIFGHSRTGVNANLRDVLCTMLKACILLGKYPDVVTEVDATPVDYVSQAIVRLARRNHAFGNNFHLCNPQPIAWNRLIANVRDLGYPLEGLPYAQWVGAISAWSTQHPKDNFFRQLRLLLRSPIYLFAPDKPQSFTNSVSATLAEASIVCPPVDQAWVSACFAYFQHCGFLTAPPSDCADAGCVASPMPINGATH